MKSEREREKKPLGERISGLANKREGKEREKFDDNQIMNCR